MKFLLVLLLSFNNDYEKIIVNKCTDGYIEIIKDDQIIEITAFNIEYINGGEKRVCEILKKAKEIKLIDEENIDDLRQNEKWIYVDGNLLQKLLIENNLARVIVSNPDYKYSQEINSTLDSKINLNLKKTITTNYDRGIVVIVLLSIFSFLSIIVWRYLWRK